MAQPSRRAICGSIYTRIKLGGNSGPVVIPKKAAASEMIRRITLKDTIERCPQRGSERRTDCNSSELDRLGAIGPEKDEAVLGHRVASSHWSFQPGQAAALPAVKDEAWVRNPIDRFILAGLDKEGIALRERPTRSR